MPQAANQSELSGCLPAFIPTIIHELGERLDMTPAGRFRREVLRRNLSRKPWVNQAIASVGHALAKEIIDRGQHDSIIEAIKAEAEKQQGASSFGN